MKVKYDETTKTILHSAGISADEITRMEERDTRNLAAVLAEPIRDLPSDGIARKFADDDLMPLGASRDH